MENLIDVRNLDKEEVIGLFDKADEKKGKKSKELEQKTLGMVFEKASTRTRTSFEVGMTQLGGDSIFLSKKDTQLGRGEPIKDTARVLSRYVNGLMARLHGHEKIIEMTQHSEIPIINGLTDKLHPCQALTDYYTIRRKKGLDSKVVFLGRGDDNVCSSLINTATVLDKELVVSCPSKYRPEVEGNYSWIKDPFKAVEDAEVVYTDVWKSMGEKEVDKNTLKTYQVNSELLDSAKDDYIFMHCLPAHRGEEVTDEVIESGDSVVFDQAENRLHLQKAILLDLMK